MSEREREREREKRVSAFLVVLLHLTYAAITLWWWQLLNGISIL